MPSIADNSGAPVPTLPQAINSYALTHPGRPALEDDYRHLTWAELLAECLAVMAQLQERGVTRLGMVAGNEAGHLTALIAAAAAGIPAVPAARDWTAEDIGRRFRAAGVDLVLCSAGDEARIRAVTDVPVEAVTRTTPAVRDAGALLPGGSFADLNLIAPTGGTSGKLKFAYITHANTVARFITQVMEFGLQRRSRFYCATPLFHGGGRSFSLCHLYLGGTTILRQRFDAARWLDEVRDCVAAFIVPTMATRILDAATTPLPDGLRVIISGAKLDPAVTQRWKARVGGAMFNYYGSVESGAVAAAAMDSMLTDDNADYVGLPAFGVHVDFRDTGRDWPEIAVRGPGVAIGIEIEGGGMRPTPAMNPGDLVAPGPGGGLHHKGRADDVIISGGVNVYPSLVEQTFREVEGIAELSLVGIPSPEWGEELVLAVAPRPGAVIDEEDLRAFAREKLARYAQPKRYYIAPTLPLTAAGKIDRRALVATLKAGR